MERPKCKNQNDKATEQHFWDGKWKFSFRHRNGSVFILLDMRPLLLFAKQISVYVKAIQYKAK